LFDPGEEVLDAMALAIPLAVKRQAAPSIGFGRDAGVAVLVGEHLVELIAIVGFVRDDHHVAEVNEKRWGDLQFIDLPCGQHKADGSACSVDHGVELGVQATLGAPDGVCILATFRVGPVLMYLNEGSVDRSKDARSRLSKDSEDCFSDAQMRPPSPARVDAAPATKSRG
jgi:hypothetical protein